MRMIEMVRLILAVSTGIMTVIVAIPEVQKQMNGLGDSKNSVFILVPTLVMVSTVAAFSMISVLRYKRNVEVGVNEATTKVNAISRTLSGSAKKKRAEKVGAMWDIVSAPFSQPADATSVNARVSKVRNPVAACRTAWFVRLRVCTFSGDLNFLSALQELVAAGGVRTEEIRAHSSPGV